MQLEEAIRICPLIAILRGIRPDEAAAIGHVLVDIGFTCLEVPLNSPQEPLASIYHLQQALKMKALIGAGTVLQPQQVMEVAKVGGRLIISPHTDPAVIHATKESGLYSMPGFATPSEAFTAIRAGCDALKFFPAASPATLKAITTILPKDIAIFPVGGITPASMRDYKQAGATGFGLGAVLYQPGDSLNKVAQAAQTFYDAFRQLS
jgi:2-dehydro-3-deoxyphosphogalactonate aldolase